MISGNYMHIFVLTSRPVVFKHFRVHQQRLTNFHLQRSFYIDINKNIISHFTTLKMLFDILLPISRKQNETSLFLAYFCKQIDDKWWSGVCLGRQDRRWWLRV